MVKIPSGTEVSSIENGSQQWAVIVGYQGQSSFVLKVRGIDLDNGTGLGSWQVLDEFENYREAHAAMLDAYNKANGN